MVADSAETTAHLVNGQLLKSKSSVVRRVPGDLRKCRERQRRQPLLFRPAGCGIEKRPAKALAGVTGIHGYLFYVSTVVDDLYEYVCHGFVRGNRDNPGSAINLETCQFIEGEWVVVGYGRHAQFSE